MPDPTRAAEWYKDAVIYQLHVKAFHDSNADGIGDFRGLIQKLDYLQELGVTALWLLPFYPSPLRDDGYDTADYTGVHPDYGTMRDVRAFLREAHDRGLKVITELVLNHTSDQHPWFKRARRAKPGSPARDFYVWSDTPDRYKEARIIFKDFEHSNWSWDPVAEQYFWHRFYSHQPDLNFDNPEVKEAVFGVLDFWLDLGVDGLRLDAVPYLIEREGTNCENLPETHAVLRELRERLDAKYDDRMLLAEANQWPEDAVAYFGDGDECHMAFHFPLMPRMFMATRMEDRFPIIDILEQTPDIPDSAQWALFLRNHDELTLEMVTDEERDYMYRVYAEDPQARINLGIRRRLAPLLGGDRRKIEMLNGLLFSLPGTPIVYYGDEIGMGDNIYLGDRNGVRTPMQWSADRNAGFSRANPQRLYLPPIIDPEYHFESVNVEAQQGNPNSLLWWMRRLIGLRGRHKALGRGSLRFLHPGNRRVLAFVREHEGEHILVVANLSRFAQYMELDLSDHEGMTPVELMGGTEFPRIGKLPYLLTLGPYAFYWFSLMPEPDPEPIEVGRPRKLPAIDVSSWHQAFAKRNREALARALPAYLRSRRWFGGKARRIKDVTVREAIPVTDAPTKGKGTILGYLVMASVEYSEGDPESYVLPLTASEPDPSDAARETLAPISVARVPGRGGERLLHDALMHPGFADALLTHIARRRHLAGSGGNIVPSRTGAFSATRGRKGVDLEPRLISAEQSNTSVVYGDRLILKLFRRPDEGENPDLEIGRFLRDRASFEHIPPICGALEFRTPKGPHLTLGILQALVPNEGDAWEYTMDALEGYVQEALAQPDDEDLPGTAPGSLVRLARAAVPEAAHDTIGPYLESVRLLGQRTAELHRALGSDPDDEVFAPEAFTPFHQRSLYQSLRATTNRTMSVLRERRQDLEGAPDLLSREREILARFEQVRDEKLSGSRIRIHGDFHLGQVLWTGKDFVFIDFEGEPARPLSERRIKRSPLKDVAGMLRSFQYAAAMAGRDGTRAHEDADDAGTWLRFWHRWVSATYLRAYLEGMEGAGLLPDTDDEIEVLLGALMLEKALYEVAYEANNRPDWIGVPIEGVIDLLEAAPD